MTPCAYADEIEELAFGACEQKERAKAHLATCEECRTAHARFVDELALFEWRTAAMGPAPDLTATILTAADQSASSRWGGIARATRGLAAMAACAAAIISVAHFEAPRYLEASANASESMTMSRDDGEPLACEFPASGFVTLDSPAPMSSANEPLMSMMIRRVSRASFSADLRYSCEERVTFSRARP